MIEKCNKLSIWEDVFICRGNCGQVGGSWIKIQYLRESTKLRLLHIKLTSVVTRAKTLGLEVRYNYLVMYEHKPMIGTEVGAFRLIKNHFTIFILRPSRFVSRSGIFHHWSS